MEDEDNMDEEGKGTFKCTYYKAVYKTKQGRSRHELVIHKIPTVYHCKKCLYSTTRKDALQRHNKKQCKTLRETPTFPKLCREFKRKSHLKIHMETHKKQMHSCRICNRQFKRERDLLKHEETHSTKPKKTKKPVFYYYFLIFSHYTSATPRLWWVQYMLAERETFL